MEGEYVEDIVEQMERRCEAHILANGLVECCECKAAVDCSKVVAANGTPCAPPLCQACYAKGEGHNSENIDETGLSIFLRCPSCDEVSYVTHYSPEAIVQCRDCGQCTTQRQMRKRQSLVQRYGGTPR